jgi:glycogen debranching enzyme
MRNQSWKDSGEAIVHADGSNASLPIATCELQGYVVAAKRAWAEILCDVYDEQPAARVLRDAADRLTDAIESRFWWEAEGTYYLGLDGGKRPIESVASNAGHLLWARAVVADRAAQVAERLAEPDMWSGWGVRTLSEAHRAYNPFSYQRGAVWPHDNALIVEGLCAYGEYDHAGRIARGVFDAANCFRGRRLPEVFAGLTREAGSFPAQYLGANTPQAWASGAPIQMISAFLRLEPDASARSLRITAHLPDWLTSIRITQLGVGQDSFTLDAQRDRSGRTEIRIEPDDSEWSIDVR